MPEIEGMSVRELDADDLPLVWAYKKTPGGEACPAAALQLAFTGADGVPDATDPVEIPVGTLLKEAGYDPS